MKHFLPFLFLLLCVPLTGCGDGALRVSGTISFPDNSPLTAGAVIFSSSAHTGQGALDANGRYSMSLPPGNYKVHIAYASVPDKTFVPPADDPDAVRHIFLIHSSFASVDTTPLACDVTKSGTHNFTVEKPEG